MALGKPRAVGAEDQRHVRKNRRRRAQRTIQQRLLQDIRDVVRPANHMRDSHVDVVDNHAQLISWRALRLAVFRRTQQDEVLDFRIGHFARPEDRILEARDRVLRNANRITTFSAGHVHYVVVVFLDQFMLSATWPSSGEVPSSCDWSFGPVKSVTSNSPSAPGAIVCSGPVAVSRYSVPLHSEPEVPRRAPGRHDGAHEVVLQGRHPAVAHFERETTVLRVGDVEAAELVPSQSAGPWKA